MQRVSLRAIAATAGFGALLGGCATSLDVGPGYYRYDSHVVGAAPTVVENPVVVERQAVVVDPQPAVVYREPAVVYRDPVVYSTGPVVYREATIVSRPSLEAVPYRDHGQ